MLRYRVAIMIWMFFLLALAHVGGLASFHWSIVWSLVALGASYVAATSVNDVADRDIDAVNHPQDRGRPLVIGEASEHDLRRLHVASAGMALTAAALIGWRALALIAVSVAIGRAYSLPPIRLSYRTCLAPIALGVAYVLVPYGLGLASAGRPAGSNDALFAGALYALFLARITLKDFRDVVGDARYGRPTFLLQFGKDLTCLVSLLALAVGDGLLMASLHPGLVVALLMQAFVLAIVIMLRGLWRTPDARAEQVAIGIGARMGNGLLITSLALLVVRSHGAPAVDQVVIALALTIVFVINFAQLASRPDDVLIGYKG